MAFPGSELIEVDQDQILSPVTDYTVVNLTSGKLLPLIYGFSFSLIRTRDLLFSAITLSESAERQKT